MLQCKVCANRKQTNLGSILTKGILTEVGKKTYWGRADNV
jgi:hypothetical protein